jgi:hypothetical protein
MKLFIFIYLIKIFILKIGALTVRPLAGDQLAAGRLPGDPVAQLLELASEK